MPNQPAAPAPRHDMSVILVTGSYDHEIRFWEAWSGICSRTIARYLPIQRVLLSHPNLRQQVNRLAISPECVRVYPGLYLLP
jgi:G protein beta subunit-like protein